MTPDLVLQLRKTKFKAKKGTDLYNDFGDKVLFIVEMDEMGDLCVGTKQGEGEAAWYDSSDLEIFELYQQKLKHKKQ